MVQAQTPPTLVTPGPAADGVWYRANGGVANKYIAGVNTAMIDYVGGPNSAPYGRLVVSDYYGNGIDGGVAFLDQTSGDTQTIDYWGGGVGHMDLSPDIVVGNSTTAPLTDYIVAAAYITLAGSNPQIDYYLVHYTTPGYYTVSSLGSTIFSGFQSNTIHVDIIAETGHTGLTGLPFCGRFVITCDDAGKIEVYSASLNSPPSTLGPAAMTVVGTGIQPDVAGIQRLLPPCSSCTPVPQNMALVTYTDATKSTLYYVEYNFPAAATSATATLDASLINSFNYPRIDAPDDYTINSTTSGNNYYTVVAEIDNTFGEYSMSYTPVAGIFPNTWFLGGNSHAPTVAFGANSNTQYSIAHRYNASGVAPPYMTLMEPIDWTLGTAIAAPNDYYRVNSNPFTITDFENGNYLTAISTPGNFPSDQTFVAWSIDDMTPDFSTVYYKSTGYIYAFRPANATGVVNEQVAKWNVYPNPTEGQLNVDNPVTDGTEYEVTDMAGRTLLHGTVQAGTQAIDVHALIPGSYIINMYGHGHRAYNKLFVKD